MSHYEISPREREDEARRWEHDFGITQETDVDERDRVLRSTDTTPQEVNQT